MTIYLVVYPEKIGKNIEKIQEYLSDKNYSKRFVLGKKFEKLGKELNLENDLINEKEIEIMGYKNKKNLDNIVMYLSKKIRTVIIKQKYIFSGE